VKTCIHHKHVYSEVPPDIKLKRQPKKELGSIFEVCQICEEVRQMPFNGKDAPIVLLEGKPLDKFLLHRFYEQHKVQIIADYHSLGYGEVKRKWGVSTGGLFALLKKWGIAMGTKKAKRARKKLPEPPPERPPDPPPELPQSPVMIKHGRHPVYRF